MSIFINVEALAKSERRDVQVVKLAWCKVQPILAVSSNDGVIRFFHEEGNQLADFSYQCQQSPGVECKHMDWRLKSKVVACGWDNGTLGLRSLDDSILKEDSSLHGGSEIVLLQWSPDGSLLLTGDKRGVIGLWKTDYQGRVMVAQSYQQKVCLFSCAWITRETERSTKYRELPAPPKTLYVSFYKSSSVASLGTAASKMILNTLSSQILSLTWVEYEDILISLAADGTCISFKVGEQAELIKYQEYSFGWSSDVKFQLTEKPGTFFSLFCPTISSLLMLSVTQEELTVFNIMNTTSFIVRAAEFDFKQFLKVEYSKNLDTIVFAMDRGGIIIIRSGDLKSKSAVHTLFGRSENMQNLLALNPTTATLVVAIPTYTGTIEIFYETNLLRKLYNDTIAMQKTGKTLWIQRGAAIEFSLESKIHVKGISLTDRHLLLWNFSFFEIYEFSRDQATLLLELQCVSHFYALDSNSFFKCNGFAVECCSLQGVLQFRTAFTERQGMPCLLEVKDKTLIVCTNKSFIISYTISKSDIFPCSSGIFFNDISTFLKNEEIYKKFYSIAISGNSKTLTFAKSMVNLYLDIYFFSVNCDATKIAILCRLLNAGEVITKISATLFVLNIPSKSLCFFELKSSAEISSLCWDVNESNFLSVQCVSATNLSDNNHFAKSFICADDDLLPIDEFPTPESLALLGCKVPFLFFVKSNSKESWFSTLELEIFKGIQKDEKTKKAVLEFYYYMSKNNLELAYSSIRFFDIPSLWLKLLSRLISLRNSDYLDIILVCAAKLEFGSVLVFPEGVDQTTEGKWLQVARICAHLKMFDEAESIYRNSKSFDLLTNLYQSRGLYEGALDFSLHQDRIHLRSTHFNYGKHLESIFDYEGAIKHYEASHTSAQEIPRMLFKNGEMERLETYVNAHKNNLQLVRWLGSYYQSVNQIPKAEKLFKTANDLVSLVQMNATESVENDKLSCFLLGKKCEESGEAEKAIQFYRRSGAYVAALRLAKGLLLMEEVFLLGGLVEDQRCRAKAAKFLLQHKKYAEGCSLFERSGQRLLALKISIYHQLPATDQLVEQIVSDECFEQSSLIVLNQCAEGLIEQNNLAKAVELYMASKQYESALSLCEEKKIHLSDISVQKMRVEGNTQLLLRVAKICENQKSYLLASQKYVQAGDKLSAMKSLVLLGDTSKILFFAKQARVEEIYVLAANFLQTLDWRSDNSILENIVLNLTKAQQFSKLSSFFYSCAVDEVSTFKNFNNALTALDQAILYSKMQGNSSQGLTTDILERKRDLLSKFVLILKDEDIKGLEVLIESVRCSFFEDILPLHILYRKLLPLLVKTNSLEKAKECAKQMKALNISFQEFLTAEERKDAETYEKKNEESINDSQEDDVIEIEEDLE